MVTVKHATIRACISKRTAYTFLHCFLHIIIQVCTITNLKQAHAQGSNYFSNLQQHKIPCITGQQKDKAEWENFIIHSHSKFAQQAQGGLQPHDQEETVEQTFHLDERCLLYHVLVTNSRDQCMTFFPVISTQLHCMQILPAAHQATIVLESSLETVLAFTINFCVLVQTTDSPMSIPPLTCGSVHQRNSLHSKNNGMNFIPKQV